MSGVEGHGMARFGDELTKSGSLSGGEAVRAFAIGGCSCVCASIGVGVLGRRAGWMLVGVNSGNVCTIGTSTQKAGCSFSGGVGVGVNGRRVG